MYIKLYSICLHLQSVITFCVSTLYPDRVHFQWCILNVNKIKVVACFCKVISNFYRYVSKFACVKFQTNLVSFCWIIAINLRGLLFSGHSVQYRWFHATCIYVIKMPRVYVYFCLHFLDSTLSYNLRIPDHVLYARNVTFYNFSFPCLTSFTCPHVETFLYPFGFFVNMEAVLPDAVMDATRNLYGWQQAKTLSSFSALILLVGSFDP